VRLPMDLFGPGADREALQEFTALLSVEGVFAGMSWHDAKHAATAIMFDATKLDGAVESCSGGPQGYKRALTASPGTTPLLWPGP